MSEAATRALEDEIRRLPRIGKAAYLPIIKKHLNAGADPNADAINGKKSIMTMAMDMEFPMSHLQRMDVLPLLVASGGNPLMHPTLLLKLLIKHYYLDTHIFDALHHHGSNKMPLLSEDGGNLLHVFMLQSELIESVIGKMNNSKYTLMCEEWLQQKNDAGQTPYHVMWTHLDSTWIFNAWEMTRSLVEQGGYLDTRDVSGKSIRDVISNRLDTVDYDRVEEEHPGLGADIMGWLLQENTPHTQTARPGPRL
jgi:hypothetical protein